MYECYVVGFEWCNKGGVRRSLKIGAMKPGQAAPKCIVCQREALKLSLYVLSNGLLRMESYKHNAYRGSSNARERYNENRRGGDRCTGAVCGSGLRSVWRTRQAQSWWP